MLNTYCADFNVLFCSYPDITFYLLHTTSFVTLEEVKKSLLSFKYFTSGWVLEVEWKKYAVEGVVLIIGKVRHSYAANKTPLRPWILVRSNGSIIVAHCTCMAGLAETCSHVGAILHWVETAVRVHSTTTCTPKENTWLMPKPKQSIPYLQLSEIDFSAPKLKVDIASSTITTARRLIKPPSLAEKDAFFHDIAKEQKKKPLILSVIDPYSENFVLSSDHIPHLMQGIFNPANLECNYTELLTLADNFAQKTVTPEMVARLAQMTVDQSKCNNWFKYRAGRITASRFKQVLHTDPYQPSLSLLKSICYPDIHKFTTQATTWGCEHEKEALMSYKTQMMKNHLGFAISCCGFFVSVAHPFLGASPDALIQCDCCGEGVVEIKCPFCIRQTSLGEAALKVKNFCLDELPGHVFKLKRDHSYYYQCQLQIFVTTRRFCDFVVWSPEELYIERITLDETLIEQAVPNANKFWRLCVLPELLGKWYTRNETSNVQLQGVNDSVQVQAEEEDSGTWCYCREDKGGDMIACDNKSCHTKWFHLDCVGISISMVPNGKWLCPTCHTGKQKAKPTKKHR